MKYNEYKKRQLNKHLGKLKQNYKALNKECLQMEVY